MKILSGLIYHESNTFNPFLTSREQFVFLEGEEILERLASTEVFREAGAEIVPAVYATALSSGPVKSEVYEEIKGRLLNELEQHPDLDGIWLHLHGAMLIEGLGAAEDDLLEAIRQRTGPSMPISVTLDPHGNLGPTVAELSTVLRAYRTIPHVDQPEIERRTARHLVDIINKRVEGGSIAYRRVPFIISGDIPLSGSKPLSDILRKLNEVEAIPGILDASYFVGFAWADVAQCSGSVLVVPAGPEHADLAQAHADELVQFITSQYSRFKFETPTLDVTETVKAFGELSNTPLVVSDSGDNTTGGAVGYSTALLREVLAKPLDARICITTVWSPETVRELDRTNVGDIVKVAVGMGSEELSQPVEVEGALKAKGDLLGYMSSAKDRVGKAYTISVGNLDVVVTDIPGSFVTLNHFHAAGLRPEDYEVIIVKQGYMFPEISKLSKQHIMCISPGATYQFIEKLAYQNVDRDMIYMPEGARTIVSA